MRTIAITAFMATLVAIPLILHMKKAEVRTIPVGDASDPRRYDLFDFVS
jgi:hypothetical protein